MRRLQIVLWILLLGLTGDVILAQETDAMTTVQVEAEDGLMLVGDLYIPSEISEGGAPAVLLMHMYNSRRSAYEPLIPALTGAGYIVINVDLRGHGDTGGTRDWPAAIIDVQTWLDWLREQDSVRDEGISIIGASIGSNLALIGCANDAGCVTAIALSPGLDYFGVTPSSAVEDGFSRRSVLLVASQNDVYSANSVREMFNTTGGDASARVFAGRAHGTELFATRPDVITNLILDWLNEHNPTE